MKGQVLLLSVQQRRKEKSNGTLQSFQPFTVCMKKVLNTDLTDRADLPILVRKVISCNIKNRHNLMIHNIQRAADKSLPGWGGGWCVEGMCGREVLLLKGLDQVGAVLWVNTPERTFSIGL